MGALEALASHTHERRQKALPQNPSHNSNPNPNPTPRHPNPNSTHPNPSRTSTLSSQKADFKPHRLNHDVVNSFVTLCVSFARFDGAILLFNELHESGTTQAYSVQDLTTWCELCPQFARPGDAHAFVGAAMYGLTFQNENCRTYYQEQTQLLLTEFLGDARSCFERFASHGALECFSNFIEGSSAKKKGRGTEKDWALQPVQQRYVSVSHLKRGDCIGMLRRSDMPEVQRRSAALALHLQQRDAPKERPGSGDMIEAASEETYAMLQSFAGLVETEVVSVYPTVIVRSCSSRANPHVDLEGNFFFARLTSRVVLKRQLRAVLRLTTPHQDSEKGVVYLDPVLSRMLVSRGLTTQHTTAQFGSHSEKVADLAGISVGRGLRGPGFYHASCNPSQARASGAAMLRRLTLVQGPPGTGKTFVAIGILNAWVRQGHNLPVLATADSNIAVDNLVLGCVGAGLRVVRTGRPEGIRPELLEYCIEQRDGRDKMSNEEFHNQMRLRLKGAQVICSTCVGAGSESIEHIKFKHVLIDESTQATETATLCAIVKGHSFPQPPCRSRAC